MTSELFQIIVGVVQMPLLPKSGALFSFPEEIRLETNSCKGYRFLMMISVAC